MVSCSFEAFVSVRHLHLQREYVNYHNSKCFKKLGDLHESSEMSGFVKTTPLANGLLEHDRQGFVI